MPSFIDCIVVPHGLSELAGAARTLGVQAYADGQYAPVMAAAPVSPHTVFVAHSRNGKFVACLRRELSENQNPPSLSFTANGYLVDVYDTDSWQRVHTAPPFAGGNFFPNGMVVSNAGVVAIAAGSDGVRVVDAVGKAEVAVLTFNGPPVTYMGPTMVNVLEFSPDEDYLFVARVTYGVAAFKTADWTRDETMKLDAAFYDPAEGDDGAMQSPTNWLKFSPTGDAVYLHGPEHGFRGKSWPALEAVTLPALNMGGSVTDLGFSPDGQTLYYALEVDGSGVGTLHKLNLADAAAEPVVVVSTAANTFKSMAKLGFSLSADSTKVALMGYATGDKVNREYGGAEQAALVVVLDASTGAVEKSTLFSIRGNLTDAFAHFALWLPLAKLQLVTGLIKDADGAGVARDVLLSPRSKDSLAQPQWTQSDATGRFKVPVALKGELLSRVVFDSTGTFNDLIDKVQV